MCVLKKFAISDLQHVKRPRDKYPMILSFASRAIGLSLPPNLTPRMIIGRLLNLKELTRASLLRHHVEPQGL